MRLTAYLRNQMMDTIQFPHNPLSFDRKSLNDEEIRQLYGQILLPRMIEEKMLSQLRQGKISKWFSGMGQEAISVGAAAALEADNFIPVSYTHLTLPTIYSV